MTDSKKAIDDWAKGGNPVENFPVKRISLREKSDAGDVLVSVDFSAEPIREADGLTDQGDANRLLERYGDRILVVNENWHAWNGRCWEAKSRLVANLAVETSQAAMKHGMAEKRELTKRVGEADDKLSKMSAEELETPAAKELQKRRDGMAQRAKFIGGDDWRKWYMGGQNVARIDRTMKRASGDSRINREPADMDLGHMYFAAANGYVNLKTGKLEAYEPRHYGTMSSKVAFDPDAKCPQFLAFLEQIQPKPEVRAFLQRWFGYNLTGEMREHKTTYLLGEGRNGKGTLIEALRKVLGEYWLSADPSTFAKPRNPKDGSAPTPDVALLASKRMVTVSEIDENDELHEARLKAITGEDPITAAHKHAKPFTFHPQCKLTFLTNNKPRVKGADVGIWSRIILVPFEVMFDGKVNTPDLKLKDKLAEELPGILNWLIEGCLEWQRLGGLNPPEECTSASQDWQSEAAQEVHAFFAEEVDITPGARHVRMKFDDLYGAYRKWQSRRRDEPMTSKIMFARKLSGVDGISVEREKVRPKTTWVYCCSLRKAAAIEETSEDKDHWSEA